MANKSKAQVALLVNDIVQLRRDSRGFLGGSFYSGINNILSDAILGDEQQENIDTVQAAKNCMDVGQNLFSAVDAIFETVIPHIGRLVGAPDINDADVVMSKFNDWLFDNSESVRTQDFLHKFTSLTAGVSNVGTGKIGIINTDPDSQDMNISHVETLTFVCSQDATKGATAGREVFDITGKQDGSRKTWERGGSNVNTSYQPVYGGAIHGFSSAQRVGQQITSVGAGRAAGNILRNGDFEIAISGTGTAKLSNWTFLSGDGSVTNGSTSGTDLINGLQSLKATGNFSMYQNLSAQDMPAGAAYGVSCKFRKVNGGSGTVTGTITINVESQDGVTTYATLSYNFDSDTVNTNIQTPVTAFILPIGAKPVRVKVTQTILSGSAATPTIVLDDVILSDAVVVDGGRAIAIHDGSNLNDAGMIVGRFAYNDTFTASTGAPSHDGTQRAINEVFGRYVRHTSGITVWG